MGDVYVELGMVFIGGWGYLTHYYTTFCLLLNQPIFLAIQTGCFANFFIVLFVSFICAAFRGE